MEIINNTLQVSETPLPHSMASVQASDDTGSNASHSGPDDPSPTGGGGGCSLPKCELNRETGYVIYSAIGSFYAPMLVMIFFNWRIFRTATKTTQAIRQGWTKVKGADGADSGKDKSINTPV